MNSSQGLLENLRKVISLVDQLRDIGLNDYIKLPRIVVLGIQSAGKSSLLEQIVGIDFLPRGSGVVTRRPLELRLQNVPKTTQTETTGEFIHEIKGKKFTNFAEVKQQIIALTDKVCGNSKNIVDQPIILQIQGPNCPDLTLVDLPGITRIAVGDQPKNIEEITTSMAKRYCEDPSTIILCAVAANADMTTSDALLMAKRLDPNGDRTIGVLTKIDIMDQGTDALSMLKGKEVPLKYGYVGVKLRSQQDINDNTSVADAIKKEKNYFANHPVYSSIPGEIFGSQVLTKKLTMILYKHIRSFLPQLMTEINGRVRKIEKRLNDMGPGLPFEDSDKLHYIWQLIHEFSVRYKNSISGSYEKSKLNNLSLPPAGAKIRIQFQELYDDYLDPNFKCLKKRKDEDIIQVIQKYQAQAIPGFLPVDAFYALLDPELKKLSSPAIQCVDETYAILEEYAQKILEAQLKQLPAIQQLLKEQVLNVLQDCKKKALDSVNESLEAELNYIFTNDYNYLSGKQYTKFGDQAKDNQQQTKGDPMVNELKNKIEHFFKLVVRTIRDNIPKLIGYFLVKGVQTQMLLQLQQNLMKNPQFLKELSEPPQVVDERKKLSREVETFKNAQKLIKRDPDLSEYILKVAEEEGVQVEKPDKSKAAIKPKVPEKTDAPQEQEPPKKPNDPTPTKLNQQPQQDQKQTQQPLQQQQQQQQGQGSGRTQQNTQVNQPLGKAPQGQQGPLQTGQKQTLTQQYNNTVDKSVASALQNEQVKAQMGAAGGAAAKATLASQVPGAPDWALNAAEKAGQQAATSDAANKAIQEQVSQQLKVDEQPVQKPPAKKGLFGFIQNKDQ